MSSSLSATSAPAATDWCEHELPALRRLALIRIDDTGRLAIEPPGPGEGA